MEPPPPIASRKRSLSFSSPHAASSSSAQAGGSVPIPPVDGNVSEKMSILALGAGQEVGRSCIVIQYRGCSVMLDCGLHTQRTGLDALPFFDMCDLDQVDLLLVTHFHMDHIACLPYLTEHTNFTGRVFMTHPTKAVMRMLLTDYVRKHVNLDDALYNEADLISCLSKCEVIDTHQTWEVNGIGFQAYTAGHVLGACMYMVQMAGVNVLYTGDYSTEEDRHLMTAEVPSLSPDVLIVESTFGIADHERREDREYKFTSAVEEVASRNKGCCLIPVFALGRAQELLLILDEYWQANHHLQDIPIYYATGMSSQAVRVYQTYINMMNDHIRSRQLEQPFSFRFIKPYPHSKEAVKGPCVVMATPGTLEGGLSGKLMSQWCSSERNGVILTGFLPEGTPAKELTRKGKEITLDGIRRDRNCAVHEMSFAAHVDFSHNYDFISRVRPANIVLVHGEKKTVEQLQRALVRKTMEWPQDERPSVYAPANVSEETNPVTRKQVTKGVISLRFQRPKRAKAVGKLAEDSLSAGVVNAVLVAKDFGLTLVSPEDLNAYAPLFLSGLTQRLHVPFSCRAPILISILQQLFVDLLVKEREDKDIKMPEHVIVVSSCVRVLMDSEMLPGAVVLEWDATPASDMIADAVVAAAMHAQSSPQSLLAPPNKSSSKPVEKPMKSKGSKKKVEVSAVEDGVEDALEASSALERELLLKLCDLLEMKFDIIKLVEIESLPKYNWMKVFQETVPISTSPPSELKSRAWALQVSEPVSRGVVSYQSFSYASCLVRWVKGHGVVVESMPCPAGGTIQSLVAAEDTDPLTPQCRAWTNKQLALEKGIDSTLARALVALGPVRADAVL